MAPKKSGLSLQGIAAARCTTERLMRVMGFQVAVRSKMKLKTIASDNDPRPFDPVRRSFVVERPNQLWLADFSYAAT
jgi:putative transposase